MKVAHSKIISAVCSVLLFATALFLLILLFTDGFSNAMNSNGSNVGESIGKACTGAVVVVSSVFAVIAQALAGVLCLSSTIAYKRKGSVYTANAFCILFSVIAGIVYAFTIIAFAEVANLEGSGGLVYTALITGFSADLIAIISCIISMVTKGKAFNQEECAEVGGEKLSSFIIGGDATENGDKDSAEGEEK